MGQTTPVTGVTLAQVRTAKKVNLHCRNICRDSNTIPSSQGAKCKMRQTASSDWAKVGPILPPDYGNMLFIAISGFTDFVYIMAKHYPFVQAPWEYITNEYPQS